MRGGGSTNPVVQLTRLSPTGEMLASTVIDAIVGAKVKVQVYSLISSLKTYHPT